MTHRTSIVRYYEDLAGNYDNRFDNQRLEYMRSVENKILLNSLKPGLILDIGCGTGEQTLFLAKKDYQVIGVDISGEMIRIAKDRVDNAGLNDKVSLIIASAEALPFKDDCVDGLISIFGVYSHVPKINIATQEIYRVLHNGSLAVITVVNRWNLIWWVKTILNAKGRWLLHALTNKEYTVNGLWTYYFSKSELSNILKNAGFKVSIGCLLLLLYPHNNRKLYFYEKFFLRFEDKVRWLFPFNSLGFYHLAVFEKK